MKKLTRWSKFFQLFNDFSSKTNIFIYSSNCFRMMMHRLEGFLYHNYELLIDNEQFFLTTSI